MTHTALITGGASGIGFNIAQQLAKKGINIILTDLDGDAAANAAAQIQKHGGQCQGLALNVTDNDVIDDCVHNQLGGKVDILVNNAGIQHVSKIESFPPESFELLTDVMLNGPAMLTRAVIPGMRERNFGRIVNIGSIHGLVASKYKSAYVAAKHGLIGFSKVVALETGDADITINTICPAYVKTPLVEKQIADQARNHKLTEQEVINNIMLAPMPKKAFIGLDEIAHAVKFLIAPEARNITGQALVLDGGWTVQ